MKLPTLDRKAMTVLEILSNAGGKELYGLDIVAQSEGLLKRGSIYTTLARMEEEGLIESRLEPSRARNPVPARRRYGTTAAGRLFTEALNQWQSMQKPASKKSGLLGALRK